MCALAIWLTSAELDPFGTKKVLELRVSAKRSWYHSGTGLSWNFQASWRRVWDCFQKNWIEVDQKYIYFCRGVILKREFFFFNFWYLCLLVVNHIQWSLISETGVCEQRNIVYISVAFFSKLKDTVWMFFCFFCWGKTTYAFKNFFFISCVCSSLFSDIFFPSSSIYKLYSVIWELISSSLIFPFSVVQLPFFYSYCSWSVVHRITRIVLNSIGENRTTPLLYLCNCFW